MRTSRRGCRRRRSRSDLGAAGGERAEVVRLVDDDEVGEQEVLEIAGPARDGLEELAGPGHAGELGVRDDAHGRERDTERTRAPAGPRGARCSPPSWARGS